METGRAIQIVTPVDHAFQLNVENLKTILDADAIKDRYAVIISIAGALRKGKSFLLNFILKYLNAQVMKLKIEFFSVSLLHEHTLISIQLKVNSKKKYHFIFFSISDMIFPIGLLVK